MEFDELTRDGNHPSSSPIPPPSEWSIVAVRLLQGVVYHDDSEENWEMLLKSISPLEDYFAKLGLVLVVDEPNAMAYLRQLDEEEWPTDYPAVPRLFRRTQLSYDVTLLCVLLRDELRRFEEHEVFSDRCVISQQDLLAVWQAFFPAEQDPVKSNRTLAAALKKLEEIKFVRQFEKEPPSWEIRRIIKARVPIDDLEKLRQSLVAEVARRTSSAPHSIEGDSIDVDERSGA